VTLVLIDTSVWVEYLRDTGSPAAEEAHRLLQRPESVATCGPVTMELLSGARGAPGLAALERLTNGLVQLELDERQDFHAAAAAYRAARTGGRTVRGLVDCLIAVIAERHGATLVHRDADLASVAAVLQGLQQRDLR
jgi:predicted nucleic acid-binding protein